tara:strand:+ start:867 stop:1814 length:948 start_codon:yes stop_codon:yes gene_type:complete
MPSWMITGSGQYQPTKWGGGSIACKTAFKSLVMLKKPDGKLSNPSSGLSFNNLEAGDILEYEVFTGAKKTNGESDEFSMSITSLNWPYLIPIINQVYSTASAQQKAMWDKNENLFIQTLSKKVNANLLITTYVGQLHNTSSEGLYRGSYTIPSNIPSGPMTFNLLYGYNNDARSSDYARGVDNAWTVLEMVAFAVEIIVALAVCPATGGVGCAIASTIFTAQFAVELGKMTYEHLYQTAVGRNKYGCSFPNGGFVHNYALLINNPNNDPFMLLEDRPGVEAASNNSIFEITTEKIILGVSLAGLFIIISSLSEGL